MAGLSEEAVVKCEEIRHVSCPEHQFSIMWSTNEYVKICGHLGNIDLGDEGISLSDTEARALVALLMVADPED